VGHKFIGSPKNNLDKFALPFLYINEVSSETGRCAPRPTRRHEGVISVGSERSERRPVARRSKKLLKRKIQRRRIQAGQPHAGFNKKGIK
jgi:hypothetical protein